MRATFCKIPEGLYAFGDTPFRVRQALGGPFTSQDDAFLWLIDRNEKALTPVQLKQWAILHDAFLDWEKIVRPTKPALRGPDVRWSLRDRLAGLLGIIDALESGQMFGAGKVSLEILARYAAGGGWHPVFEQLKAVA